MNSFLNSPGILYDVRSPCEYQHAHIPGALNLPLFSNEERALVGTCYKQKGKDDAIELGLKLVGPKLHHLVHSVKEKGPFAKVYCARGGMRSASVAWLLRTAGIETLVLPGGYKKFRNWALSSFALPRQIKILGGFTGCGKTEILLALQGLGENILDLEDLAHHKGSSFGAWPGKEQPSIEHFENKIAMKLSKVEPSKTLWIEDESRLIGACKIPDKLFFQMRSAPVIKIEKPKEERIAFLSRTYTEQPTDQLISATGRLEKRLGREIVQKIIAAIKSGDIDNAINFLLEYYDATYSYGIGKRDAGVHSIFSKNLNANAWAQLVREYHV